jgi:ribosomal protein S7
VTTTCETCGATFADGITAGHHEIDHQEGAVSGATYRIDVEHQPDPQSRAGIDWIARIVRLSDDRQVRSVWGKSDDEALAKARAWLFAQSEQKMGRHLFVNDEGSDEMPS